MAETSSGALTPTTEEDFNQMHALYRQGGQDRQMAPHIVYPEPTCPHVGCGEPMQAIDFRLEVHGRAVHEPGGTTQASSADVLIATAGSTSPSDPSVPSRLTRQASILNFRTIGMPTRPSCRRDCDIITTKPNRGRPSAYSTIISPFITIQCPGNVQR